MTISELAQYLKRLDQTAKRLEITTILAELIGKLKPHEIENGINLILGQLKAPYEGVKFNIADKMMVKILAGAYTTSTESPSSTESHKEVKKEYDKAGDLGTVAFDLASKRPSTSSANSESKTPGNIEINNLHTKLVEIAVAEGSGSQEQKINKTIQLLAELDPLSAKYVVRIILGTTRLGFTELTVVAALAEFIDDKKQTKKIEQVYTVFPDIGKISEAIKKHNLKGLDNFGITPGVPVLAQKPQRLDGPQETIEKMGRVWAEYKFDGTRVQLHLDKAVKSNTKADLFAQQGENYLVKTFTRNQEETTHQYPELIAAAKKYINAKSVILDGEAIGYDKKTGALLPFQETIKRKRKHNITESADEIPLKYFVFDILYLDGKSLVEKPLEERRRILQKVITNNNTIVVDDFLDTQDPTQLQEYYNEAVDKKLEGLVVKNPADPYQAGARSFSWVKLKKANKKLLDDSLDCVVLGYYAGRGERASFGIGKFLAGIYDPENDEFKTVTKVGSGLTDEAWVELKKECDKYKIDKPAGNVKVDKMYTPDVVITPKLVVAVGADELSVSQTHTAGFALRFPRLLNLRKDKKPTDATTLQEVKDMYSRQIAKKP